MNNQGFPVLGAPPAQSVMELAWGMWGSSLVQAAARLDVAEAVGDEPVEIGELAKRLSADPDALFRMMRALAGYGIFRYAGPRSFEHTEASRALRSDAPIQIRDIILIAADWGPVVWSKLAETVRTGQSAFRTQFGKNLMEYCAQDDQQAGYHLMHGYAAQVEAMNPALVDAIDVAGVDLVADIGGGHGTLMRSLLERHASLHGILFDTELTLKSADQPLKTGPLAERCRLVPGDIMRSVPAADLYLIRQVLHMWDDDTCVRALRNCADAAGPGSRLIVIEQLISDPPEFPYDGLMDVHMLLVMEGRERGEGDFRELFERAGWRLRGITKTTTPLRLIEASWNSG
ncbi:methyltransferase [Nonomuraea sp. NPDC059007]|uniref:methyltransferase n=1 Tax=Nonomuraea sp. NPDC059007 TaxID=3346692 RepID=UPI0036C9BE35